MQIEQMMMNGTSEVTAVVQAMRDAVDAYHNSINSSRNAMTSPKVSAEQYNIQCLCQQLEEASKREIVSIKDRELCLEVLRRYVAIEEQALLKTTDGL